jgi:hypothetical protein
MNAIKYSYTCLILLSLILVAITLTGCPATTMSTDDFRQIEGLLSQAPGGADDFVIVDCALPGQIMQLGRGMMFISRGPSQRLPAGECAIQGGRFALPGQTRYDKALVVWMPDAKAGDKIAQNYVGEIYQRGMGDSPKYALAAKWYRKAADQGLARAQMNLAYLYEKGLGVEKDPQQALRLLRRATGLGDSITLDENALNFEERQELQKLRDEVNRRSQESKLLGQQLEQNQKNLENIRRKLEQLKSEPKSQTQSQDVDELTTLIDQLKKKNKELKTQLAENNDKWAKLPAPRIEVYNTLPRATRGDRYEAGEQDPQKRLIAGRVWAPAGLTSFTVNQKRVSVKPDGDFSVSVTLNPSGDTIVAMVAVDQRGIDTRITHKLDRSVVSPPPDPRIKKYNVNFGRYHALIIGNNNYSSLERLLTAVNDAREIDKILREKYGFETTLLLNANRLDIILAIERLKDELKKEDNLLIYYAGHSFLDETNMTGYWQPVNADKKSTAHWIRHEDITDKINIMVAKQVLIIADACYSGRLAQIRLRGVRRDDNQLEPPQTADVRLEYIEKMAKKRARRVLTSGGFAPVMDDGGGGHSVFARVLLDTLESNDDVIEGNLLHQQINARVLYESKRRGLPQTPLYASIINAGEDPGDFIFVPKAYQ